MRLFYKVVTKDRKSAVLSPYSSMWMPNGTFIKDMCLIYEKGTTVKAPEGTMGIFLFDTKEHAECFASLMEQKDMDKAIFNTKYLILRVLTHKKISKPLLVGYHNLQGFYSEEGKLWCTSIKPSGTVCCPEVVVLD